ncbi:MAG: hypothetical protein WED09_04775 [Homoserinimonas sp.]
MRPPNFQDTRSQPLTSQAQVEERVRALIGRACRHQLWFLFLDGNQVQLPLMIPLDDLPSAPDDTVHDLARAMGQAMEAAGAESIIVVIERYASSALTPVDMAWAKGIHDAFDLERLDLRGVLLSHNRGVRWVAQDDYRFAPAGRGASAG